MLLEPRNATTDFGLWKAEKVASLREAFGFDDLGENNEIAKIEHRTSPVTTQSLETLLLFMQRFVLDLVTSRQSALRAPSAIIARRSSRAVWPRESGRAGGAGGCDSAS